MDMQIVQARKNLLNAHREENLDSAMSHTIIGENGKYWFT